MLLIHGLRTYGLTLRTPGLSDFRTFLSAVNLRTQPAKSNSSMDFGLRTHGLFGFLNELKVLRLRQQRKHILYKRIWHRQFSFMHVDPGTVYLDRCG
jgi:hypothetical protein